MSDNCINSVVNSFKTNTLSRSEASVHGAISAVGIVTAVALMILNAPLALTASIFAFSAVLLAGSTLQSKGLVYTTWLTILGFYLASAILTPAFYGRRVVVQTV